MEEFLTDEEAQIYRCPSCGGKTPIEELMKSKQKQFEFVCEDCSLYESRFDKK